MKSKLYNHDKDHPGIEKKNIKFISYPDFDLKEAEEYLKYLKEKYNLKSINLGEDNES